MHLFIRTICYLLGFWFSRVLIEFSRVKNLSLIKGVLQNYNKKQFGICRKTFVISISFAFFVKVFAFSF